MERRTVLKNISLLTAGMALFQGCSDGLTLDLSSESVPSFSSKQNIWLEAISEAILPKGEHPYTTFETFPQFISKMLKFENEVTEQLSFMNGYNLCTEDIKTIYKKSAGQISPLEIVSYFTSLLEADNSQLDQESEEEMIDKIDQVVFCNSIRSLTIRHITSSKEYQEKILKYKLVPSAYQSCVEV